MHIGRPASVSCTGKMGYETRQQAKAVIRSMKAHGKAHTTRRNTNSRLSEYICHYCGYYHVGHVPSAPWEGRLLDATDFDYMELRKRPRLNGPILPVSR